MEIEILKDKDNGVVIKLGASFDASNSDLVKEKFTKSLNEGYKEFTVDFSRVDFIDSSGLGVLVGFFKKVKIGDGQMKLTGLQPSVLKIFKLTHLDKVFSIQ